MKKRGQFSAEIFRYLLIIVVVVMIIVFGIRGINQIREAACKSDLILFKANLKKSVEEIYTQTGSVSEKSFNIPCKIDTIYFVDLNKNMTFLSKSLYNLPLVQDFIESDVKKNVILVKNKKIVDSFYTGDIDLQKPYFVCSDTAKRNLNLYLSGLGSSTEVVNMDCGSDCTFELVDIDEDTARDVIQEAIDFGCGGCPKGDIDDEMDAFRKTNQTVRISRRCNCGRKPGQAVVEILIKPEGKVKHFKLIESIPKEYLEEGRLSTYLRNISGDYSYYQIKQDPLIMWHFNEISEETIVRYVLNTDVFEYCAENLKTVGIGVTLKSEGPGTDLDAIPVNRPWTLDLPDSVTIDAGKINVKIFNSKVWEYVSDPDEVNYGVSETFTYEISKSGSAEFDSSAGNSNLMCKIDSNKDILCSANVGFDGNVGFDIKAENAGTTYIDDFVVNVISSSSNIPSSSNCTDGDNDDFNLSGVGCGPTDCDDGDDAINPGAIELCNGINDDCNASTSDGSGVTGPPNSKNRNICSGSNKSCIYGVWEDDYTDVSDYEVVEMSCDGIDNDCDGHIDKDLTQKNLTKSCYTGTYITKEVGLCSNGIQTCSSGSWGTCIGEITPQLEICDGKDNDCDNTTDEDITTSCYTGTYGTLDIGLCHGGTKTCSEGLWSDCIGEVTDIGKIELCDGDDNDCDGDDDDDGLGELWDGNETDCGTGKCYSEGILTCKDGRQFDTCEPGSGLLEICNNIDDDCDGEKDEYLTRLTTCGVNECAGNTGQETCSKGVWGNNTCNPYDGAESEICDNLDNNCNREIDEGLTRTTYCGVGICLGNIGYEPCIEGIWIWDSCNAKFGSTNEVCDNLDNNCNGATDEGLTESCYTGTWGLGVGLCHAGWETCYKGSWGLCQGEVTPQTEICGNGQDDDCDGEPDSTDPDCISGKMKFCRGEEYLECEKDAVCTNDLCIAQYGLGWRADGTDTCGFWGNKQECQCKYAGWTTCSQNPICLSNTEQEGDAVIC